MTQGHTVFMQIEIAEPGCLEAKQDGYPFAEARVMLTYKRL